MFLNDWLPFRFRFDQADCEMPDGFALLQWGSLVMLALALLSLVTLVAKSVTVSLVMQRYELTKDVITIQLLQQLPAADARVNVSLVTLFRKPTKDGRTGDHGQRVVCDLVSDAVDGLRARGVAADELSVERIGGERDLYVALERRARSQGSPGRCQGVEAEARQEGERAREARRGTCKDSRAAGTFEIARESVASEPSRLAVSQRERERQVVMTTAVLNGKQRRRRC